MSRRPATLVLGVAIVAVAAVARWYGLDRACEALVALYLGGHALALAADAVTSWVDRRNFRRERSAREHEQRHAAEALAETLWTLSISKNAAQRARLERDRERRTRRLIEAFGMEPRS